MGFSALEVIFYSEMRYINLRFTYLLYFYFITYLLFPRDPHIFVKS